MQKRLREIVYDESMFAGRRELGFAVVDLAQVVANQIRRRFGFGIK